MSETIEKTAGQSGIKTEEKTQEPKMYAVVVHNDPYTPRSFVVEVLQRCFQKNADEASRIMLSAHRTGTGMVATYTYEIAETKAAIANNYSQSQNKLLLFSVEEV